MSEVVSIPQLRFPEFRDEWRVDKFVDLCKFQQGVQVDVELQSTEPKNNFLRFLRIENYTQKSNDFRYIPKELSSNKSITENEIAIVRYGATAGYIGRGLKGVLANNLFKLVLNKDTLDTDYLFHLLRSYKTFCFFQSEMSGGAMPALSFGIVGALKLPYSSISEQQKIAAFLTAVDTKIEQLSKKKELLGEYKKGLMQKIFSQAIRFKADDGSDFSDWEQVKLATLSKLVTKQTGYDYSSTIKPSLETSKDDSNIPFVQNKDFNSTSINLNTDFYVPVSVQKKYPRITLDEKCLLITISGNIGNVGVYNKQEKAFIGGAVCVAKFKDKDNIDFVKYYLTTDIGQKMMLREVKASSHQNITVEGIRNFRIMLPYLEEQKKIVVFLSIIDNKIEQAGKQLIESKQFKKALLQQMFV